MVLGHGPDGGGPGRVVGPGMPHAGQHGVAGGGVDRVAVGHRADDRVPVGQPGEAGEQLADLDAGDGAWRWAGTRPGCRPGRRAWGRRCRAARGRRRGTAGCSAWPGRSSGRPRGGRRGPEQAGQAEAQAGDGPDAEEVAPRGAVAKAAGLSHGPEAWPSPVALPPPARPERPRCARVSRPRIRASPVPPSGPGGAPAARRASAGPPCPTRGSRAPTRATASACSRGTTTTPSPSATTTSPGRTSTPPTVTGRFTDSTSLRPGRMPRPGPLK